MHVLAAHPSWVLWGYKMRGGRWTKPPVDAETMLPASTTNPATWCDFETASAKARGYHGVGLGFVLTAEDGLTGIDLDHVRDPETGMLEPWVQDVLDLGETYGEVSPSGTGVHLFASGKAAEALVDSRASVEVYGSSRFLTITGRHLAGTPDSINPAPRTLEALRARVDAIAAAEGRTRAQAFAADSARKGAPYVDDPKSEFHPRVNRLALASDERIGQWLPQLHSCAFKNGGAWRLTSEDLCRDLEEDVSVTTQGIVDFGVADLGDPKAGKRTAIDLVCELWEWESETFKAQPSSIEAALWLCARMGVEPVSYGYKPQPDATSFYEPPKTDQPTRFTAAELQGMHFAPLEFVVPGYIQVGCTLLVGSAKIGKSWLVYDVVIAKATGGTCLGGLDIGEPEDCLYLALEDGPRRLQSRMKKLLPFGVPWPARLTLATRWRRSHEGGLDDIREWAKSVDKPRIVVVDILAMVRKPKTARDDSYLADYEAVKCFQDLAAELNIAIVIVHHTRKSRDGTDPFDRINGTTGLSGGVDAALILDRTNSGVTLYTRGRDVAEVDSAVEFDKDNRRWKILGKAAEVQMSDARKLVTDVLLQSAEAVTSGNIADLTGNKDGTIRRLLAKMVLSGEVIKTARGRYVHPSKTELI